MIRKVKGIHSGLEKSQRNSLSSAQVAVGSGDSLLAEYPSKKPGCPLPVIRVADIHSLFSFKINWDPVCKKSNKRAPERDRTQCCLQG